MTEWLGNLLAVLAVLAYVVGLVATWVKLGGRVENAEKEVAQIREEHSRELLQIRTDHTNNIVLMRTHHSGHFSAIGDLQIETATLTQRVTDHHQRDEERFARIEHTYEEINRNIIKLLERTGRSDGER